MHEENCKDTSREGNVIICMRNTVKKRDGQGGDIPSQFGCQTFLHHSLSFWHLPVKPGATYVGVHAKQINNKQQLSC
jgi:hypothetical protein